MKKIKCVHCRIPKVEDNFSWSNKTKGIRNKRCKECQKEYSKKHYTSNKTNYIDRQQIYRDRNRKIICDYLKDNPCVDCGETDIVVLEFDHKDGFIKDDEVSNAISNKWGKKKIMDEIKKCDVRCSNCHIKRHAREIKSFKYIYGKNEK